MRRTLVQVFSQGFSKVSRESGVGLCAGIELGFCSPSSVIARLTPVSRCWSSSCSKARNGSLWLHQPFALPSGLRGFSGKTKGNWGSTPPVSMQTLIVVMITGAGGVYALKSYRNQKVQQVMEQTQKVAGKASVGGPFELKDYDGKPFTDKNLRGEFAILYFGFTHCPDICPDELEKVAEAIDLVDKHTGVQVVPVFISVDPERDTPARVKSYVKEFHPRMLGLTGELDAVKRASKAYRVYYSKTGEEGSKDYLVDHSIIHYLIDPDGEFVTFYSKSFTQEQMSASISEHLAAWQAAHPDYHKGRKIEALPPVAVNKAATVQSK